LPSQHVHKAGWALAEDCTAIVLYHAAISDFTTLGTTLNLQLVCHNWSNIILTNNLIVEATKYSQTQVTINTNDYDNLTDSQISMLKTNTRLKHLEIYPVSNVFNDQLYNKYARIYHEGLINKPNLEKLKIHSSMFDLFMFFNLHDEDYCQLVQDPSHRKGFSFVKNDPDQLRERRVEILNILQFSPEKLLEIPHIQFFGNLKELSVVSLTGSDHLCMAFTVLLTWKITFPQLNFTKKSPY